MNTLSIEYPTDWTDYELIDSGDGDKLEKIGGYIIIRPDPRIIWMKKAPPETWQNADAVFARTGATQGNWNIKKQPPIPWIISYHKLKFTLRPTEFKHIGLFPEQATNWNWIKNQINGKPLKVLNLFAYTGGATLAALSAGAEVTHVDSVKSAIDWANDNLKASNLDSKPVRWIIDDASKFVEREIKRGSKYDGIIMDPPRFGRGSKGEVWKIEKDLPKLLETVKNILSDKPKFILINAYTADLSVIALVNTANDITNNLGGTSEFGELALQESFGKRLVSNGIYYRWSNEYS
jgi:23S rRNA (cytosine1962-C5)-methyltransferase